MNRCRCPTMILLALAASAALAQDLRLGYALDRGPWQWSVFGGANNLFDESYNANTRINAAVGRYVEPGPPRNLYAGVEIKWVY